LKAKYSRREKNRTKQILHGITNKISSMGIKHGFEDLDKKGMLKRNRKWNRELSHTDWKTIVEFTSYKSSIELCHPYHTSKECSRCGCVNKDLNGTIFRCVNKDCGLKINRQPNAAINIYLKMEGLSHEIGWFDENIVSGFTQTGAELKETDELVRSLYDTMKPQFYESLHKTT
jgi:putative transposase